MDVHPIRIDNNRFWPTPNWLICFKGVETTNQFCFGDLEQCAVSMFFLMRESMWFSGMCRTFKNSHGTTQETTLYNLGEHELQNCHFGVPGLLAVTHLVLPILVRRKTLHKLRKKTRNTFQTIYCLQFSATDSAYLDLFLVQQPLARLTIHCHA